jgi:hypothetical protein
LSFNFEYRLNPFENVKPKQKSGVQALTYPLDGFLWKEFDNKFKAKLAASILHTDEEIITAYKIWVAAWHEPSKKLIDLPNPVSLKLLFDNNPLQNVTESEAVFLLGEIGKLKMLEGEWTNGLVKPPRRTPSIASIMRDYLGNDLIREEVQRSLSSGSGIMSNIPRDERRGGSFQIPVQPAPADPHLVPRMDWQLEAERLERIRRSAVQQQEIERAAWRMARPQVRIDYPAGDEEPDWGRF